RILFMFSSFNILHRPSSFILSIPNIIYILSLHDALPISYALRESALLFESGAYKQCDYNILVSSPEELRIRRVMRRDGVDEQSRSEEHTSELQSSENLVCRLLLEQKKHKNGPTSI